ncbi:MAG: FUSC family protein [Flavipsychrobacter sp.]|nr:FUSC family protein [Flavipsychrobacter sp.]
MAKFAPYKQLSKLIAAEAFEPTLAWGVRMAIAATVPLLWGLYTGNVTPAMFITLTAECICWVELKGTFGQRVRTLFGGAFLSVFFALLGTVTGVSTWLSIGAMLAVAFISSLFKNLGDRGSGLAICVYLLFIFCNAYPVADLNGLEARTLQVLTGAGWTIFISILTTAFMPAKQAYRRSIAIIWKNIAALVQTAGKGWTEKSRSSLRQLYLKEKEVRTSINASFAFHEKSADQVSRKDKAEYHLAQLRKASALVATHIINISEEAELISRSQLDASTRMQLASLSNALQQTAERMAMYIATLKPEEKLLLTSRVSRINKLLLLMKNSPFTGEEATTAALERIVHLAGRTLKLIQSCINRLELVGEDLPVFRSYSLVKTLFTLHPRHWIQNLKLLFNFNTFTTRYAARAALAAAIAMFIYKWFDIYKGYWLPFSVIIVLQPYFGATFRKSLERIIGTVAGGIVGGSLLYVRTGIYLNEILLCLSFIFMIYYLRRNYAIAVFVVTINLVLLFNLEEELEPIVIVTRTLATAGGCGLAVLAGFAFLPHWDKKWLPIHLAKAIYVNYEYFIASFFSSGVDRNWTKYKRNAESDNSNVFDSFNRYMEEPSVKKKHYANYYQLITHNVRITRELNNIQLEQDNRSTGQLATATEPQQQLINDCLEWYNKNIEMLRVIDPGLQVKLLPGDPGFRTAFLLTRSQEVYTAKLLIELKEMYYDLQKLIEKASS